MAVSISSSDAVEKDARTYSTEKDDPKGVKTLLHVDLDSTVMTVMCVCLAMVRH